MLPKCTKSWAKAVSGNWSNANDWSPAGVPTNTDNVCIAVDTANYTVTVDTSVLGGIAQRRWHGQDRDPRHSRWEVGVGLGERRDHVARSRLHGDQR